MFSNQGQEGSASAATGVSLSARLVRLLLRREVTGEVRHKTLLHIADAVAIAWAATRGGPLAGQVHEAVTWGAGGGACRVLGSAVRHPPALAAFANSALIHLLDFDDIHDTARLHPTVVTLPAALAAAELANAAPARVVDAVARGNELMCRLGALYSPTGSGAGSDWFLTQLFGYLGACLAACVVLDFDEAQTVSALGLACMQVAGGKEAGFGVGSTGRAIYPAFAAMGGVHAALLAKCGVVGPASALDGAAGLFKIYLQGGLGEAQSAVLLAPEGWQFSRTQVKPWPSCRLSHPYVSAALGLRAQAGDARWRRVEIAVNASAAKLCAPLAERRRPQTLQDAKYSVPYMTAFTLVTGRVDLSTLNLDALADAQVLALTDRIEIVERLPDGPGHPPAKVRAETLDGRVFNAVASNFDLSEAGVRDKFDACLAFAGRADKAALLWEGLAGIDDAKDLDFLFA